MYYQNQYNRNKKKQKVGYLQKLTLQLAVVLVILLLLILVKYVNNSVFNAANESLKKVFYNDITDKAVDVFNNSAPGAKSLLDNIIKSRSNQMNIEFLPVSGKIITNFGVMQSVESKENEIHSGIDIEAVEGTDVKLIYDGTVDEIKLNDEFMGQTIVINHNNGFRTLYAHLSSVNVDEGQRLKKGDIVGKVGKTGKAAATMLHFELLKNYEPINPLDIIKSISN